MVWCTLRVLRFPFSKEQLANRYIRGALSLPPSDVYVKSFLYLFYTLMNLYYTKALSDQALSLVPDRIPVLWRPRIPASFTAYSNNLPSSGLFTCGTYGTVHSNSIDHKSLEPMIQQIRLVVLILRNL